MAQLAINGGSPVAPNGLAVNWPVHDGAEREALLEVLDGGRWCARANPKGKVAQAEKAFAKLVGTRHARVVSSGTTALELALRACDISYGDEVIVPSVTFLATASSVITAGAVPVFVDIDPDTYQISPEAAEAAVSARTRAILPVHYGGYPADMDRIAEIAKRNDLLVIEDCAEAHLTEWRGTRVGSLGDIGCFSFQMSKSLTCGEGGAITFDDESLAPDVFALERETRTAAGKETYFLPAGNWRMSEFVAAILLAQMVRLEEQTARRYENARYLLRELETIDGVSGLKEDPRVTRIGYFFFFLKYDASRWNGVHRNQVIEALRAEGIMCGTAHNEPLYRLPMFRQIKRSYLTSADVDYSTVHCPEAERVYETEAVAILNHLLAERRNVELLLTALHKLRDNIGELENPSRWRAMARKLRGGSAL